ncbi:hypothetical protein Taro_005269, partial [Colocasia esculenta]|nr:hypothetical protein [Colocasia esculenta]
MSAKLLNVFGDENPDFQKQIGCMSGIFQMFDRQHLLTGRRLNGHNHKRLPSANAPLSSSYLQAESQAGTPRIVLEKNARKSFNENQRVSVESSGASFSTSCSSSFSSAECGKSNQRDPSLYERTAFRDRHLKCSAKLQVSDINRPLRPPPCQEIQESCTPSRQSLNFRDVVKDSIYRDSNGLSVKTSSKEEVKKHKIKHRDSPRPLPLSKSMDGSYLLGINEKPKMSRDLKESLRVLAKLKEAPRYFSEDKEPPRSSYEAKDGSFFPVPKETPRFSYDGREISYPSLDSRDNSKYSTRLRELPRLSLDSRQSSLRRSNFDSKSNSLVDGIGDRKSIQRSDRSLSLQQDLASHKPPSSVVAKLMGLEPMPLGSSKQDQLHLSKRCITKDSSTLDGLPKISSSSKSPRMPEESRQERPPCSPKGSLKDSVTPRLRTAEPTMKPISTSRLPIETAPWRQQNKSHGTQKIPFGSNGHVRKRHESVYSEVERKLRGLEFQQSNKDLRALKHILAAIQAKGLLETKKAEIRPVEVSDDNYSNVTTAGYDQNLRTRNRQTSQSNHPDNTLMKGANTSRPLESPIVIMKPAKSVNRAGIPASSVVHFDGLSNLRKVHIGDATDTKRVSVHSGTAKEHNSKLRMGENASQVFLCTDKKSERHGTGNSSQKTREMSHGSPRHPQSTRENSNGSMRTSGSSSPRLQQKKLDLERKSRPPTPTESTKQQKQSKHVSESVSPRGKIRPKAEKTQQNNDHLSEISSEMRNTSHYDDESSLRTESNVSFTSQLDVEVTSADRSAELDSIFTHQHGQSPPDKAVNDNAPGAQEKKSLLGFGEDAATELATTSLEHPSPVSVLDASFYRDDQPLSPVNKISNLFRGDDAQNYDIPRAANWKTGGPDSQLPNNPNCDSSSTMSHKKLESIENLLQKLRRLSASDDKAPAMDHIACLCENQNPEHRYVSEVLLASGLLLKDIGSAPMAPVPIQLHKSGYPINPDLFLVLEQTKTGILATLEQPHESSIRSKPDPEKLHRKLLFDTVNEILVQKLELTGPVPRPKTSPPAGKLTERTPTGKQLLKELCLEVERLQAYSHGSANLEEEDDTLKSVLCEDIMRQSGCWVDLDKEVPGLVLDIERSIFKDLIDEVVKGESAAPRVPAKSSRLRRQQLYTKVVGSGDSLGPPPPAEGDSISTWMG